MRNPIRVLQMIGSLNVGGSQAMIINLFKNIDRSKVQFDFIVDRNDELHYKDLIESLGGKIYYLPRFRGNNAFEVKSAWRTFLQNHPEYKVLHSHVRSYASLYIPVAKKYGLKTIIHSHNTSSGKGLSAVYKALLQFPLRFQADYFIGCSKEAGEWLFGKKRVSGDRYFMLQNAVDIEKLKFNREIRDEYRRDLKLGDDICFIHVGRFTPQKNHMFLLDVFAEIVKQHPSSRLLVLGDGDLRGSIEEKIKELNLWDKVSLLGNRNDVHNILQAADCFLFPSLFEGLPVTAVEAQAAGVPCYISDTVTKDIKVSELARYLPIDKGAKFWADRILSDDISRIDVSKKIKDAGFDVKETAKKMELFYTNLHNQAGE